MARAKSLRIKPEAEGGEPGFCAVEGCGGRSVFRVTGARTGLTRYCCGDRRHAKAVERSFNEGVYVRARGPGEDFGPTVRERIDNQGPAVEDSPGIVLHADPVERGGPEAASDTSTVEGPSAKAEDVVADGPVSEATAEPQQPGDVPEMEPREVTLLDDLAAMEAEVRLKVGMIVEFVQPYADRSTGEFLRHPAMVTRVLNPQGIVNLCVFNSYPSDAFDAVRAVSRAELDPQGKPGSWHFMGD
jgi:hypothetical protein